jgi:electron transfer flavoprotein beta subunit
VKQVPDSTEVKMDPVTNTLDRSSAPAIINPYDAHAVEEAVRIKKKFGGKVIIISMGPPQARDVIKKSVEMGADEGILLSDRAFAGSDTLATSYILSQGIRKIMEKEKIDMIFCGKQAIDGDTAQVGPGISRRLNIPQLTYVEKIAELNPDEGFIIVHRKIDNGYEVVKSGLPCLLTIEKSINDLSYSTLPDMIRAARYQTAPSGVNSFSSDPDQMGLKGSPTSVRRIFAPPQRACGEILKGSREQVVKKLVDILIKDMDKWQ